MANLNLDELKKNIYHTYFSDGVWDIILGLVFLSFGLGVIVNQNFWYMFPILVTLPLALKRSISEPRVGVLKFKKSEKTWLMVFYFLFNFLVLGFVLLLGMINPSGDGVVRWFTQNLFLVIGLIIAIILGLVGWFIKFQRLFLYAFLIFIGFALIGRIFTIGYVLTGLGVIITISGILVMRNFIVKHPKISLPVEGEEEAQ